MKKILTIITLVGVLYITGKAQEDNRNQNGGIISFSHGLLLGSEFNEKPLVQSYMVDLNYRFNKYGGAGIFAGLESLNEEVLPVGLNLVFYLPVNSTTLFVKGSSGYSISTGRPKNNQDYYWQPYEHADGGFLGNVDLGITFANYEKHCFYASIGYRYNELNYVLEDWRGSVDRKMIFNRFNIRFGFMFY
ncbi:MAG: hypothetical protein MI922_02340 [Bacteroidales bacterium]|nr:hypothetical protein [Bacteroidales bacterium]